MTARRPSVLLWGAGMSAALHADACRVLGWPVRAVVSRSPARAAALARKVGAKVITAESALAGRATDVAIVATPPSNHVDAAVALLDAGYHVVVEAPLACTLDDADRLLAEEAAAGRPVLYSEHLVSAPAVDAMLGAIDSLGRLTHLSARALQPPPDWRTVTSTDSTDDPGWGGGALFDLGVHPLGAALRVAAESGAGGASSVSAVVTDVGTDNEHANVQVHFSGGLTATVVVGWSPGQSASWDLQASSTSGVLRVEFFPTPSLERNGDPVPLARTGDGPSLATDFGYATQLARFWTTVRTGRPVPVTSRVGRAVLEVVCAAHWSAGHGAVEVPLPFSGPTDRTPRQLFAA